MCSRHMKVLLLAACFFIAASSMPSNLPGQSMATNMDVMPGPFTRILALQTPYMSGKDVIILQNLLQRSEAADTVKVTAVYDEQTAFGVESFQKANDLTGNGVFCKATADLVLKNLMYDGFKDDPKHKVPAGYKFKLYVPVHKNRDIETFATLYDSKGQAVFKFKIRARGGSYGDGDPINQLTRNGNTPTGLSTCDLNSKEPIPKSYGPYPVLRVVKGLEGNTAIGYGNKTFLSNFRSGILLHTGQWNGWDPSKPMPNSLGCMHCAPEDQKNIVDVLVKKLGVKVRDNPFGKLPYPYQPQGLIAVEQID